MKTLATLVSTLIVVNAFSQQTVTPKIIYTKELKPLESSLNELVANAKAAQQYYILSQDSMVGKSLEERKVNYFHVLDSLITKFTNGRRAEYRKVRLEISSSASSDPGVWQTKTAVIPRNKYMFIGIIRSSPAGDFKEGPTVEGWNKPYCNGTLAGGSVTWTTGGHKSAYTKWTIKAKYSEQYIEKMIAEEVEKLNDTLTSKEIMIK